ncbi:MAG: hypothetical protein WA765_18475 [Candidatus Acidiferrum sp.]
MSRHRWVGWIQSREVEELLWKTKEPLKDAWERDRKDKSYPMDTSYLLAYLRGELSRHASGKHPVKQRRKRLLIARTPRTLSELVPERFVRSIWEDQHSGSFDDAIRVAAQMSPNNQDRPWKMFQGILRAMEAAYTVSFFGPEILSMPRVSILHRDLKQVAIAAGLEGQTRVGFAEFLDDLCPCGLKSHREAVRKMESRSERYRRTPNAESKKELGKKRHTSKHR